MRETWVWSLCEEGPLEKELSTHSSILAWRIQWTIPWGHTESMDTEEWSSLWDPKESCFGESQTVNAFRPLLWSCPVFPENSVSLPERIGEVKDFHEDPGSPSREVGLRFYFSVFRFSSNSPVFSLGSHHLLISLNQGAVWSVPPEYKATISYWTGEVYSSDFNDEGWEAGDLTILLGPFNKIPRIQPTLPLTNMVPDALFQNGYNVFQDEFPWVLLQPILKTPPFLPLSQLSFHLLNTY